MRIFIHEYMSGGGLSGRPLPGRLAHEGLLMLRAILEDFQALRRHQIRSTVDARLRASVSAELPVTIVDGNRCAEVFTACLDRPCRGSLLTCDPLGEALE